MQTPPNVPRMGNYVLYVLMQAVATLVFAYAAGALAMRDRKLHLAVVAIGMYLLMGAALLEIWGDRAGWKPGGLGIYLGMVSMGIAALGAGSMLREVEDLDVRAPSKMLTLAILAVGVVLGLVLVALGGSDSVVDPDEVLGTNISGGYSHLEPLGWVLGLTLFVGAALIVLSGAKAVFQRSDGRGLWLWAAGILFALWPLDIWLGGLPLTPTIMIMGTAMMYFSFQERETKESDGQKPPPADEKTTRTGLKVETARVTPEAETIDSDSDSHASEKEDKSEPEETDGEEDVADGVVDHEVAGEAKDAVEAETTGETERPSESGGSLVRKGPGD